MILADKIIMLRKRNGWSQEEMAERLQISRQSVSKWESGASIPDLDKIIKMSALFNVTTDYLLRILSVSYNRLQEFIGALQRPFICSGHSAAADGDIPGLYGP